MNYASLFNILYSVEISEDTKTDIINKIDYPVQEAYEVEPLVETYLELIDTLVFSTASEALIYNIIDETFASLSEEFINEVSNEWIKRKTEAGLKSREQAVKRANDSVKSGVIGLSQLNRQDKAQQRLDKGRAQVAARTPNTIEPKAETPKAEGAMGKLKSAVGKVKKWASGADDSSNYVGLSRLIGAKANKDNIGAETLRKQTTEKTEAPKAETTQPEVKTEAPKAETTQPEVKTEAPKKTKATKTTKTTKVKAPKAETTQPEVEAEAPKKTRATKTTKTTKTAKVEAPKAETTQPEVKAETAQPEVKAEVKGEDATKAVKKGAAKATKTTKDIVKNAKKKVMKAVDTKTKAETTQPEVKAETTQPEVKAEAKPKKTEAERYEAKMRREAEARRKDQERVLQILKDQKTSMVSKPGYDAKEAQDLDKRISDLEKRLGNAKVHEALSDLVLLLLNTNISESCFVEVMEMAGANKANALKVKDRYDHDMNTSLDDINKDLEDGKPMDMEKVKKAEEIMKKKEHFEELFKKKFNDNK